MLDTIRNWLAVRAEMKAARQRRAGQSTVNSTIVAEKLHHVAVLIGSGQRDFAMTTLDAVLADFPEEAADLPQTVEALMNLHRLDEAEALALRGMRLHPDCRPFMEHYGHIADRRGDLPERLRRWRAFRRRYPAYGLAFWTESQALLAAGQDDDAEAVLAEAVRVLRDDAGLAIAYAGRAEVRGDWAEALRRWTHVRDRLEQPEGAVGCARALIRQGLFDAAETELRAARRRFPLAPQVAEDRAVLAETRGAIDAALEFWGELRREFPRHPRGYHEPARLLRARGEIVAAEALDAEAAAWLPAAPRS